MAVQRKTDITNKPFILTMSAMVKSGQTFLTDAGRSGAVAIYTLLAFNPTSQKWVVFSDETAVDGTQYPRGILLGRALTEAEIKAGDVLNISVLVGEAVVDESQLVIESSKTLNTIVNVPATYNTAVEELLRQLNIYVETTIDTTAAA